MKIVVNLIIFTFSLLVTSQEIFVLDEETMDPISGALIYQELEDGKKKGIMSDINLSLIHI